MTPAAILQTFARHGIAVGAYIDDGEPLIHLEPIDGPRVLTGDLIDLIQDHHAALWAYLHDPPTITAN